MLTEKDIDYHMVVSEIIFHAQEETAPEFAGLKKELASLFEGKERANANMEVFEQKADAFAELMETAKGTIYPEVKKELVDMMKIIVKGDTLDVHTPIKKSKMNLIENAYQNFPEIVPEMTKATSFDPKKVEITDGGVCAMEKGRIFLSVDSRSKRLRDEVAARQEATHALISKGVDMTQYLDLDWDKTISKELQSFVMFETLKADPLSPEALAYQKRKTRALKETPAGKKERRAVYKAIRAERKSGWRGLNQATEEAFGKRPILNVEKLKKWKGFRKMTLGELRHHASYLSEERGTKVTSEFDFHKRNAMETAVNFHTKHSAVSTSLWNAINKHVARRQNG